LEVAHAAAKLKSAAGASCDIESLMKTLVEGDANISPVVQVEEEVVSG
jgi:hypothetical protein